MPSQSDKRRNTALPWIVIALFATSCVHHDDDSDHAAHHSAYAGQEARAIKSLAPEEISDLRTGNGMGLAKVAELNGLPGPRHVIELQDELNLTTDQVGRTAEVMKNMRATAVTLGNDIVETERQLDSLFATFAAVGAPETAKDLMMQVADLGGELRWTHVAAHLAMMKILTEDQRNQYVRLRGYHGHPNAEHKGQ